MCVSRKIQICPMKDRKKVTFDAYKTAPVVHITCTVISVGILSYSRSLDDVRVRIHNIRSARPEPEIEILYSVYENGE
jgi:hypothetical protein